MMIGSWPGCTFVSEMRVCGHAPPLLPQLPLGLKLPPKLPVVREGGRRVQKRCVASFWTSVSGSVA